MFYFHSGFRPAPHRSVAQPPNFYQQPPSPAVVAANKVYSHQQKANSIMSQSQQYPLVNAIQASNDNSNNPTANNMALIWQDSMPAKRHDMLTWQFQSMPKEKLIIKGNIVLCMENKFILGKRSVNIYIVKLSLLKNPRTEIRSHSRQSKDTIEVVVVLFPSVFC